MFGEKKMCKKRNFILVGLLIGITASMIGCGKSSSGSNDNYEVHQEIESEYEVHQEIESENEENIEELSWGASNIHAEITEDVILNANIIIPENFTNVVEVCEVNDISFDGEVLQSGVFSETELQGWEKFDYGDGSVPTFDYNGLIDYTALKEAKQGDIIIGEGIIVCTDHWDTIRLNLPLLASTQGIITNKELSGDLSFESYEDSLKDIQNFLENDLGMEVSPFQGYSISYQDLEEQEKANQANVGEGIKGEFAEDVNWSIDDDCYFCIFERYVNGLPMLSDYYVLSGEGTAATGNIEIGYTKAGIEYINLFGNYEVSSKEMAELAPPEKIIETLKRKFELLIGEDITLTEMKLIYFPYYLEGTQYKFVPVWRITSQQGDQESFIYIEAVSGDEVTQ